MRSLIVGAAIVDVIMRIPQLPTKGGDIYCDEKIVTVGGCAYNIANILKNFGVDYHLFVPVGEGMNATLIREAMHNDGHEILISEINQDNGQCICLVEDDGERTFITQVGLEGHFKSNWFDQLDMKQYTTIYIDGYQLCNDSASVIVNWLEKNRDKEIYFAPGPLIKQIDCILIERVFQAQPILHLNELEAKSFTNEKDIHKAVKKLFSMTNYYIIITLGSEGSIFFDGTNLFQIKGERVEVVDTFGAGDSHIASIIAAGSLGFNFIDSCKIANKVAAKIVQTKGPKMKKEDFDKQSFISIE